MSCVRVTLKDGRKVCVSVKGNKQVMAEAKKGKLRHPMDYTDDEIKRGFAEGGDKHRHSKKKGGHARGMGAAMTERR